VTVLGVDRSAVGLRRSDKWHHGIDEASKLAGISPSISFWLGSTMKNAGFMLELEKAVPARS
jgi:hypothetical protein